VITRATIKEIAANSRVEIVGTQTKQHTSILLCGAVEEPVLQFPKRVAGEQTVGPGLVAGPDALHVQRLRQLVEPAVQVVAELHQVLDIIQSGEVGPQQVEKLVLARRQILAREQLQQVPEVVPAVKGNPMHVLVQHNPRRHEQLPEPLRVNPPLLVALEIDPALLQQLNRVVRVHVLPEVKLPEIELPHTRLPRPAPRQRAILIRERQPQLYQLQHVHICPKRLVVILRAVLERPDRPHHHARKLCVHSHIRILVHNVAYQLELILQVIGPYLPDAEGPCSWSY
jgi:hypothetical protein